MKFLLIVFFSFFASVCSSTVNLATDHWPPFYSDKLKGGGILAEIAKEAFKEVGEELKINYLPWKRAEQLSAEGKYDGLFGCWFSEKRAKVFNFPKPIYKSQTFLFKYGDKKFNYNELKDLKGLTVGVMRGYQYSKGFDKAGFFKKEAVNKHTQLFSKLKLGRIDLFVASKVVAFYNLKKEMPKDYKNYKTLNPPIASADLYIGFSKKVKRNKLLVELFNSGLSKIKKNGKYNKILVRHGLK
ncbi:transporter substrate-binding domain-containing protein [Bacteriovoracales bacterium]|nr:transporter substrate-binding domain-containing protein [Bacteriovoracales bacterium]